MPAHTADEVREFWFSAATQPHWFARSEAFDARLREALGPLHAQAARGELDGWASTPRGALALILLLDQAPRNLHRGSVPSPRGLRTPAFDGPREFSEPSGRSIEHSGRSPSGP
jgi:uncharacterized protein (DUF924 family)